MRYTATVKLDVYFETDTLPEDITDEELEVRTADAVRQGHILDSDIEYWDPDEWPAPAVPA